MPLSGRYEVVFIDDDDLPRGVDFAFLAATDRTWLAVKESRVTPEVLSEAWAVYCATLALQPA